MFFIIFLIGNPDERINRDTRTTSINLNQRISVLNPINPLIGMFLTESTRIGKSIHRHNLP